MNAFSEIKQGLSDREKVNAWLDHIEEFDPECRKEILDMCASDPESRKYFVGRFEEINS